MNDKKGRDYLVGPRVPPLWELKLRNRLGGHGWHGKRSPSGGVANKRRPASTLLGRPIYTDWAVWLGVVVGAIGATAQIRDYQLEAPLGEVGITAMIIDASLAALFGFLLAGLLPAAIRRRVRRSGTEARRSSAGKERASRSSGDRARGHIPSPRSRTASSQSHQRREADRPGVQEETPPGQGPQVPAIAQRLRDLDRLWENRLISEQEYREHRRRILDEL